MHLREIPPLIVSIGVDITWTELVAPERVFAGVIVVAFLKTDVLLSQVIILHLRVLALGIRAIPPIQCIVLKVDNIPRRDSKKNKRLFFDAVQNILSVALGTECECIISSIGNA